MIRGRWRWPLCTTTPARSSPGICLPPSSTIIPPSRDAYKQVEHIACGKLVGMLPPELQPDFAEALTPTDPEVEELVKAADKLSAHIKCLEELKAGNLEFRRAAEQTEQALDDFHLPELTYFREHFLPSFRLTLDEME